MKHAIHLMMRPYSSAIGLDNQAQALTKLRGLTPSLPETDVATEAAGKSDHKPEGCPRSGQAPADAACQNVATGGNGETSPRNDETPVGDRGYRQNSPSDGDCQKWRRWERDPTPLGVESCLQSNISLTEEGSGEIYLLKLLPENDIAPNAWVLAVNRGV